MFAVPQETDDIILIQDSQTTQEVYNAMTDKVAESASPPTLKVSPPKPLQPPKPAKKLSPPVKPKCLDCEEWYQMVGAHRECDKDGRAIRCKSGRYRRPITPPNAWNPAILDTPEDERVPPLIDYRLKRKNK